MFAVSCFRVDEWTVFEDHENTYFETPAVPEMTRNISFADDLPRPMTFKLRPTGQ